MKPRQQNLDGAARQKNSDRLITVRRISGGEREDGHVSNEGMIRALRERERIGEETGRRTVMREGFEEDAGSSWRGKQAWQDLGREVRSREGRERGIRERREIRRGGRERMHGDGWISGRPQSAIRRDAELNKVTIERESGRVRKREWRVGGGGMKEGADETNAYGR